MGVLCVVVCLGSVLHKKSSVFCEGERLMSKLLSFFSSRHEKRTCRMLPFAFVSAAVVEEDHIEAFLPHLRLVHALSSL